MMKGKYELIAITAVILIILMVLRLIIEIT